MPVGSIKPDSAAIERSVGYLTWVVWLGALCCLVPVLSYRVKFGGVLSDDQNVWADFGEFFGGTLSALLGFLSLIALMITVRFQSRALLMTREELELTREEMSIARSAAEEQEQTWSDQIKVDAIFQILRLHSETISAATYTDGDLNLAGHGLLSFVADDQGYIVEMKTIVSTLSRQIATALRLAQELRNQERSSLMGEVIKVQVGDDERILFKLACALLMEKEPSWHWQVLVDAELLKNAGV